MKASALPIGTPVRYLGYRGIVAAVINADDAADLKQQGLRYEVRMSTGWVWSIPASRLEQVTAKNGTEILSVENP